MVPSLKELGNSMLGKENSRWREGIKVIYVICIMYTSTIKPNVWEESVQAELV